MKTGMNRRSFIQGLGLLGLAWPLRSWAGSLGTLPSSSSLVQVSETRNMMGTFVTITLFHPSRNQAQSALGAAFERMERLIEIFNRHENYSALGYLNDRGFMKNPPPELTHLLQRSIIFHSRTGGCFDVTIKPVLDLYESTSTFGRLPSKPAIQETLKRVGIGGLKIGSNKIFFAQEGMGITLDGIAKGTIVDKTIDYLKASGIHHALVDAGGDLRVFGGRPGNLPWRIMVYNPNQKNDRPEKILLREGAVATSGSYMVYFDQDKIHHHILSPENGESPPWSVSASIIAPTAEEADALATSLMLLRPDPDLLLINREARLAGMWITREGRSILSPRWEKNSGNREGGKDRV